MLFRSATVIGSVGSAPKAALAREAGCDHVIIGRDIDVAAEVAALTDGRGVDVAYDGIGGTMLRKMIFGPRGRYSTDLDFTRLSDISDEGIMELMLDALSQPYRGLSFRFDRDKDWYEHLYILGDDHFSAAGNRMMFE